MKKALITDFVWPDIEIEGEVLRAAGVEPFAAPDASEETLAGLAVDADVILFCFAKVTGNVLRAATKCVVACRYGIGVDNVDIEAATAAGIVVTNVPDYCMDEVGDHTLGMILALNRRFVPHDRAVKAGGWSAVALDRPMHRTRGATLGIVGFGRIGRSVAAKAKALGMETVAFDPLHAPGGRIDGVEIGTFEEVLERAEFVTVHTPLTPETEGIIGAAELARMKPGSIIVNCARGGIIDEEALAHALASGHLAGAGLDVLSAAPPPADHPLLGLENVIVTPHTAFFSQASTIELERRTAEEAVRVLNGEMPEHLVNPEVLGRTRIGL
ncbi:MAG: C-terminal binding protein [Immundisolibacterales bacterium]|nr:C-terminal binding protein [Immundisolibacterales bacterium]